MAIALVNKLGLATGTGTTSVGLTLANAVAQNDTVIVLVTWAASAGGTLSVTDSRSNTYSLDNSITTNSGTNTCCAIFHAPVTTGLLVNDVITFHTTSSVNSCTVAAYDYSGLSATPFDKTAGQQVNTTANPTSGNTTTTAVANELLIGVLGSSTTTTPTAGTGYTALDHNTTASHAFSSEYQIVSATGAYAANWTLTSSTWVAMIATFEQGSSAPVNTVAPSVSGTTQVGSVLTTTNGTWTDGGGSTFTYQWQRDVAGNGVYGNISSAISSTYTLVSADDGCHVRCVVTDTDVTTLSTSANSNAVGLITFPAPTNSVAPNVTGSAVVGSTLTTDNGTWTGSAITYSYQWKSNGVNVGSNQTTYVTQAGDVGHAVGCTVTATNDGGSASQASNTITVTSAPSLSTVVGKTGTSGTAVMQKAASNWTYITGKTGTSGTAVDQKGAGSYTKIKGH